MDPRAPASQASLPDLNSFCNKDLDSWCGSYACRPASVAAHLQSSGLFDAFRSRHPLLRAFSYFSAAGSASRLDAVWWLPSQSVRLSILYCSVLWQWDRRSDHEPVVADLDVFLPEMPDSAQQPPPWRKLVTRPSQDLQPLASERAEARSESFRWVESELARLRRFWSTHPTAPSGMDGILGSPAVPLPEYFAQQLGLVHDRLASYSAGWSSHRKCPLCSGGPGTPRRVLMSCAAVAPLVDLLRDALECELTRRESGPILAAAAETWRRSLPLARAPNTPSLRQQTRWPLLSAWRWLIPLPVREELLSADVDGSSAASTRRERGSDLAYRGVLPRAPGAALCKLASSPLLEEPEDDLSEATLARPSLLEACLARSSRGPSRFMGAIRFNQALLLGVRFIRSAYQRRIDAWLRLARLALPSLELVPPVPAHSPPASRLFLWLDTPPGALFTRELGARPSPLQLPPCPATQLYLP